MSETRCQSGKLQYNFSVNKQRISIEFEDKFGIKFLSILKYKQQFKRSIFDRYKIRIKQNKLEFKLKQDDLSLQLIKQYHQQLQNQLRQYLYLDYSYFRAFEDQSHIKRNLRFKQLCQKPVFQQIFPQIRCCILIQTQQKPSYVEDAQINTFKKNELIIYIQSSKKHSIKHITKYILSYTQQKVIFGLDQYFGSAKIKTSQFSLEQLETIIYRLIKHLGEQFKQIGINSQLIVKKITPYVPFTKKQKWPSNTDKLGIVFDIEGMFQSLPQFYFSLCDIFKRHPITFGKVDGIYLDGSYQLAEQKYFQDYGVVVFFGSDEAIAVLNLNNHFKQWIQFKRALRKGYFLISQARGFTVDQIQILIKEHRQVQMFANDQDYKDFAQYKFKPIDERSFQIHCQKQIVQKFITRAFDYLRKNNRTQIKRQQFTTDFQINLFMKLVKHNIQMKYPTVSFTVKNGLLYSRSKQGDLQDLQTQMKNQRRKMLKKIVRLPTVKPLKKCAKYEIVDIQSMAQEFCNQTTFRTLHYIFNQYINVFIKPIQSLRHCHPLIIAIIDRNFQQCQFMMQQFTINTLNIDRYHKYAINDKITDRVITYSMGRSKLLTQMLVWYVQTDQKGGINLRKLKWDIDDTVLKYKHQKHLQFVVPEYIWRNEFYFGNFFIHFFNQLRKQQEFSKVQAVTIFYESTSKKGQIYDTTKSVFQRANKQAFSLQTKMYIGYEEIQKIILTQHYSVRYWADNQNQYLSALNSFIFNYQKNKKKQEFKVPVFLKPKQSVEYEYLLCLKQNVYYKIDKYCKISQFAIQLNRTLQVFSKVIKHYFSLSEYMVVYMDEKQQQIEGKKLYFWVKLTNPQQLQQKVKRVQVVQSGEQHKLIPKKDSQIDIFVKNIDTTPKFIIQTHQDFVTEVKKIILQEQ